MLGLELRQGQDSHSGPLLGRNKGEDAQYNRHYPRTQAIGYKQD